MRMEVATKPVPTLSVVLCAAVLQGMYWMRMGTLAMVGFITNKSANVAKPIH